MVPANLDAFAGQEFYYLVYAYFLLQVVGIWGIVYYGYIAPYVMHPGLEYCVVEHKPVLQPCSVLRILEVSLVYVAENGLGHNPVRNPVEVAVLHYVLLFYLLVVYIGVVYEVLLILAHLWLLL